MNIKEKKHAVFMVSRGISCAAVGRFYGVSRQYISVLAKESGVKVITKKASMAHNTKAARARKLVDDAIRCGALVPALCEECGASGRVNGRSVVEAHHDAYSKPLDVRWLCRDHHAAWHRKNRPKP